MKRRDWPRAIGLIREASDRCAFPRFQKTVRARSRARVRPIPNGSAILQRFAEAIAYSQGARSVVVTPLLKQAVFRDAFQGFEPKRLAAESPADIRCKYWTALSCIRFRGKVDAIVGCARVLVGIEREHGSFRSYVRGFGIPPRLKCDRDIDQFWAGLDRMLADLKRRRMPFFRSTTSLLQLLLDLDYDSVKPDLIIMRLARRIGMAERESGDRNLRKVVRLMQAHAVRQRVRVAALDWYLLAFGGQTDARSTLARRFCPGPGACRNTSCPLGRQVLCADYNRRQ